jgi:hypothetical protein
MWFNYSYYRVSDHNSAKMAKWLVNTMTNHYVKTIPVETVIGRAGFKPGEKIYLPRAHHDPPEELIKYLIPDVE